jgi:glycosyltransferase involved in cell wall biosynthesis
MPGALPGLSIVLPCFDEQENVAGAVRDALSAAQRYSAECEVIVVDDGSRDGTGAVAADLVARHSEVRLVLHRQNRGYGAAVRTGVRSARMPFVLLTDGDRQFDLDQLGTFVPLADGADLLAGYRLRRHDPIGRRLSGAAWNRLVHHLFRVGVRDVDCAFKLVRRDLLERIDLVSDGAMVSTELIVRSRLAGARIVEIGVQHRARVAGRQSGANPRVVLRAFRELGRLRTDLRPSHPV